MTFLSPEIQKYINSHSSPEREPLYQLRQEIQAQDEKSHQMISPSTGRFLAFLVGIKRPQRILEIGTYGGYSTLWLAQEFHGEKITTIDRSNALIPLAQTHWQAGGKADLIDFIHDDAGVILKKLEAENARFDLFFIDANKKSYGGYFETCLRLRRDASSLVIVDNVLGFRGCSVPTSTHRLAQSLDAFNKKCLARPDLNSQILPVGDGLLICTGRTAEPF